MPSLPARRPLALAAGALVVALPAAGCDQLSEYSTTATQQYVGCVVPATFVRAGVSPTTELCLTLDANHLQTAPGTISSSDGRFQATPLRPIPQIWNDPLSTFTFGEGRLKNYLYMATPAPDAGGPGDVTVVVSLLMGDNVEVRLLRGAPPLGVTDAAPASTSSVFAVFPMTLQTGTCATLLSAANCAPDAQSPP